MSTRPRGLPATPSLPTAPDLPVLYAVEFVSLPRRQRHLVDVRDAGLLEVDFAQVHPVRQVSSYSGQLHKPVFACVSASPHLILCESRLEARVLMELDFDGRIARVASQPVQLLYTVEGRHYRHTPDFAVTDAGEQVSIIDVKPAEQHTSPKNQRDFQVTADWCDRMGFRYQVMAGCAEPAASTIRFLAGYRQHPPGWEEEAPTVLTYLSHLGSPAPLGHLVTTSAEALALPIPVILPTIYSLMWHGFLGWDITQELEMELHIRQERLWDGVPS